MVVMVLAVAVVAVGVVVVACGLALAVVVAVGWLRWRRAGVVTVGVLPGNIGMNFAPQVAHRGGQQRT